MPEVYSDIFSSCSPPCGGEAEATCTYTISKYLRKSKSIFTPTRGRHRHICPSLTWKAVIPPNYDANLTLLIRHQVLCVHFMVYRSRAGCLRRRSNFFSSGENYCTASIPFFSKGLLFNIVLYV